MTDPGTWGGKLGQGNLRTVARYIVAMAGLRCIRVTCKTDMQTLFVLLEHMMEVSGYEPPPQDYRLLACITGYLAFIKRLFGFPATTDCFEYVGNQNLALRAEHSEGMAPFRKLFENYVAFIPDVLLHLLSKAAETKRREIISYGRLRLTPSEGSAFAPWSGSVQAVM